MSSETVLYLAHAYFHQDFDLVAGGPDGVVREFMLREDPSTVSRLRVELDQMIAVGASEDEIRAVWLGAGRAAYDPARQGVGYRQWLMRIRQILGSSA